MRTQEFFDKETFTLTYAVWDERTLDAVLIDPVLDYDPAASKVRDTSIVQVEKFIRDENLNLHFVLETHAHADHLSGSQGIKARFPSVKIGIGARITEVQAVFKKVFDLAEDFPVDGRQFDRLFRDQEIVAAGSLNIKVLFTPGHTPACVSYLIEDAVFTGDALFMPDYGVGRCDFPAGSAASLFQSVTGVLYKLPGSTRVFTGHDYQPGGRPLKFESTIQMQKETNIHLNSKTQESEFIDFRTNRDKTLSAPRLLLPSVQVNIDAGHLPPPHANGQRFLTIPVF